MQDFDQVIDRRESASIKWRRYPEDVLPLWVADMDFTAPQPVRDALQARLQHGIFGYEAPTPRLAEIVAERMQRLYGWQVSPQAVVATPGVIAGFNAAARTVCAPGEGILVQPPVYPPFLKMDMAGMVGQMAPLQRVEANARVEYEVDWERFASSLHSNGVRSRMFLLCNPHNPTGQVYTRPELERMAEICLAEDLVVCSDEIHSELLLGGARHTPIGSLSPEIERRTITLIAPSKTFNIPGLFCAFAIIPDEDLRRRFARTVESLSLHVSSLGLTAAEAAYSGACDGWLADLRVYLADNRDYLRKFVQLRLPGVQSSLPQATYLAWLDCGELRRASAIGSSPYEFFLQHARVALNDGGEFGPGGEDFLRLNFGCPRTTLVQALERMQMALGI
jgi:cystathionine beta-lyase